MLSSKELREESESLLNLAQRVGPEGEGLEIDDDYEVEEIVQLRSHLSSVRKAVDVVNKGLAKLWLREFPNVRYSDEFVEWYLGQAKGKKVIEPDAFYQWLATLDAERLSKIIAVSSIKVGGMTETERMTFLDETPTSQTLRIMNKPRR